MVRWWRSEAAGVTYRRPGAASGLLCAGLSLCSWLPIPLVQGSPGDSMNLPGFLFAAALRYLFVLIVPLGLIRVLAGPTSPFHQYATLASLGVFLAVTAWAYVTTMKRYRERLAAPPRPVDGNTVRLGRR